MKNSVDGLRTGYVIDKERIKRSDKYKSISIKECTYDDDGGIIFLTGVMFREDEEEDLRQAIIVFQAEIEERFYGIEFHVGKGRHSPKDMLCYGFRCFSSVDNVCEDSPVKLNLDGLKFLRKLHFGLGVLEDLGLDKCQLNSQNILYSMNTNKLFSNVRFRFDSKELRKFKMIWSDGSKVKELEEEARIQPISFEKDDSFEEIQQAYRARYRRNENVLHNVRIVDKINALIEKVKDMKIGVAQEDNYGKAIVFSLPVSELTDKEASLFKEVFLMSSLYPDPGYGGTVGFYHASCGRKDKSLLLLKLYKFVTPLGVGRGGVVVPLGEDGSDMRTKVGIADGKGPEYICNVIHMVKQLSKFFPSLAEEVSLSVLNEKLLGRLSDRDVPYQFVSEDGTLQITKKSPRTVVTDVQQSENISQKGPSFCSLF